MATSGNETRRRQFFERTATWAVAAGPLLAAACGAAGADRPDAVPAPSQGPDKIEIASKFASGDRLTYATQVTDKFNEVNAPMITARYLPTTFDAIVAAIIAGTGPDVTMVDGSWFSDMADKGALRDVTAYAKRDKVDLNRWFALPEIFTYKGKQYGMPFWQAHGLCAYNVSLFRRFQIPPPTDAWTWDSMLDAAKRLTKAGEVWGLLMPFTFEFGWLNFMRAAGADYLNKERSKTTLTSAEAIDALQYVQDLVLKHRVMAPPGDTSLGGGDPWLQGKIGMSLASTGLITSTRSAKVEFEWDLFVTPKHPRTGKRAATVDDLPFVVVNTTKAPDAGWKATAFIADKWAQDLMGRFGKAGVGTGSGLHAPSLKTAAADPEGWLATPPPSIKVTLEQMKVATTLSYHKNWKQWYAEITDQLLPAFRGELSVKQACEKAAQVGDSLLRGV